MILLYHLVFPDSTPKNAWNAGLVLRLKDIKRQLLWLKSRFSIVSIQDYLIGLDQNENYARDHFALTFDDGYQQVFDLVSPFLLEEKIPATFFVTTSHLTDGQLLWFVYFNALCSEKYYASIVIDQKKYSLDSKKPAMLAWKKLIDAARQSGDAIAYASRYSEKYPLPNEIINKYIGLTAEQIRAIGRSTLLTAGAHTVSHPYLDQIPIDSQISQMLKNKQELQQLTGRSIDYFAYTGGVYDQDSIEAVKRSGFTAAFAITPRCLGSDPLFEIPRTDIYSPSLMKFKLKANGFGKVLTTLRSYGTKLHA